MQNKEVITPIVDKILNSMKNGEKAQSVVKHSYVNEIDPSFERNYPQFKEDVDLVVDIKLHKLVKIEDPYRN